jgi:metal-responsive CopG/Arc/MetJ family transcriptional regulator
MKENKRKVLVGLSERLVLAIDEVAEERQISRTAFIRESIIQNLLYNKRNRGLAGTNGNAFYYTQGNFRGVGKPSFAAAVISLIPTGYLG